MQNKSLLPVAQPKSLGTQIQQTKNSIHQPISLIQQNISAAKGLYDEFTELLTIYKDASFYPLLWKHVHTPIPMFIGVSRGEWIRLTPLVSNQARFARTANPNEVLVYSESARGSVFRTDRKTASALAFFSDLCDVLGQMSQPAICRCLDGHFKRYARQNPERGRVFVRELQGFLPKAEIELWHKQHVNSWINTHLPKEQWLPMAELYQTMRLAVEEPKPRRGRPASVIPMNLSSALAGGFKIEDLQDFVGQDHLGFFDITKQRNTAQSGSWASLYWALYSANCIIKLPAHHVVSLFYQHFKQKLTSKNRITDIGGTDVDTEKKPVKGTEVHRIYTLLKQHFPGK